MGERGQPRSSLLKRVLLVGLVLLILAPIVGYFTVPAVKQSVDGVISRALIAITLSQNPSGNAIDGNVATVWLADPGGTPPTLTVNFTDVTDLAGMVFQIGPAPGANYTANARPRQMELDFHDGAKPVLLDLEDDPVPQTECLKPNRQVQTFDMRVVSTYPPATGGQNLIALREVKFLSGSC